MGNAGRLCPLSLVSVPKTIEVHPHNYIRTGLGSVHIDPLKMFSDHIPCGEAIKNMHPQRCVEK